MLKDKIDAFLGTRIGKIVTVAAIVIASGLAGGYGQDQLRGRVTPTPVVVTARPTKTTTPVFSTQTPVPSFTVTSTIGVTLTITPVSTPSPTPSGTAHNPKLWHLPKDEDGWRHHHGVNPNDYVDVFGQPLIDYLTTYGEISYPWNTPDENSEYGHGHHTAYVWLYDEAKNGCEQYDNDGNPETNPPPDTCVKAVLIQVHTDGTQAHLRKRFHSHYVFMKVCSKSDPNKCGVVGAGGWEDYGILETPYKTNHCPLSVDPIVPTGYVFDLNQPPYRTSMTEYRGNMALLTDPDYLFWNMIDLIGNSQNRPPMVVQFWSGLMPNKAVEEVFDLNNGKTYPQNMPNQTVGVAWSSLDAWGIVDPINCVDPELDTMYDENGNSSLNNTAFQIFTVALYDHPKAPTSGYGLWWTNRWGLLVDGCTVASTDCVPLYVSAGAPDGAALLNRQVDQGNGNIAPILEFEVPGGGVIEPAPMFPFFPTLP